jgi:hypothetical protein
LDVIDEYRANQLYVNLMKETNMDQRIFKLEKWLIGNKWRNLEKKKIRNWHIVGKVREAVFRRETENLKQVQ